MRKQFYIAALLVADSCIVLCVAYLSLWLRFDGQPEAPYSALTQRHLLAAVLLLLAFGGCFRIYQRLWRYASIGELVSICATAICFAIGVFAFDNAVLNERLPYSVYCLYALLAMLFVGISRLSLRLLRRFKRGKGKDRCRVLIVGAGDAGATIAREIQNAYIGEKELIGFIDDDPYKNHQNLFGVNVLGTRDEIGEVAEARRVDEIIIAMPSADGREMRRIAAECRKTKCQVKIVPGLYELIDGKVALNQLRDISLEDLLRRDPVKLDLPAATRYLKGRTVLVTGAGGSIGSELCRQISQAGAAKLILLGRGENSIYQIHQELLEKYPGKDYATVICDVRDRERLERVFAEYRPAVVFHAAAHKHVPLMEQQPEEAVKNNIFGTQNVAECADRYNCERFVLISTDKAVNPSSVMGATKRVAELVLLEINRRSQTSYAAVRFGNVLGSRGSVVPLFEKQIARGGPVTVTHPEMTRYFMTIPEAVQLVLEAGAQAEGGEVFLLDMGAPVKIMDLAKDLIELHELELGRDIQIAVTGLRPGEKLYEELLTAEEGAQKTKHEKIYTAPLQPVDAKRLERYLKLLQCSQEEQQVRYLLGELVPEYSGGKQSEVCGEIESAIEKVS